MVPIITLGALELGTLLSGAVLTEQVFSIPGFGKMIVDAVFNRDYPVVQGVVLVTDMFGGSPSNLSLPACATTGRRILYGANLPMLIKLAKSRDLAVPEAVAAALDAGRKYINSLDLGGGA